MRILVADGDAACLQSIELMLKSESFNVYSTDSGEEATDLARMYDYDCVVLSETWDDMAWPAIIKALRTAKVRTPIIVLSGLAAIEDKVKGLGIGADDYITKPFHKDELVARIHAVVRRSRGHAQSVITAGPLSVDLDSKMARVNGQPVRFTGKEFSMLELLVLRRGVTLTKEAFLNHLYGGMDEPELKIIDVFICKLRRKLADAGAEGLIRTVWGRGYYIANDVEPATGDDMNHAWGGGINRQMHERDTLDAATLVPAAGQR
jgi:two-component system cell cycle response regulator CtrA